MTLKRISSKKLESVRRKPAARKATSRYHLRACDRERMNDSQTLCEKVFGMVSLRSWTGLVRVVQDRLSDAAVPDEAAPRYHRAIYLHARQIKLNPSKHGQS